MKLPYSVNSNEGKFWQITSFWTIDKENIDKMPFYNNILINHVNIDEYSFDKLSKFVKFVKIFPHQNFMLCGIMQWQYSPSRCKVIMRYFIYHTFIDTFVFLSSLQAHHPWGYCYYIVSEEVSDWLDSMSWVLCLHHSLAVICWSFSTCLSKKHC